jgi:hypothetical protein
MGSGLEKGKMKEWGHERMGQALKKEKWVRWKCHETLKRIDGERLA